MALLLRDVLLLVLAGLIVREMWCPWLDVVRSDGSDDPGGGIFDGAPDRHRRTYQAEPLIEMHDGPDEGLGQSVERR